MKDILHYMYILHDIYDQEASQDANWKNAFEESVKYISRLFRNDWIDIDGVHILIKYLEDLLEIYESGGECFDYSD